MESISVLHVDDEESFLEISSRFLKKIGSFDISIACSVQEALTKLSEKQYEVIVSDYQMPETDGIEFLKILNSQGSETPFILFTGKGREDVAIEALNQGATYYLQKGGDVRSQFHELASMISQAASGRKASSQLMESQTRFKKLADGISDFFVGLDEEMRVTFWNKAVADATGKESAEVIGGNLFELVPQLKGTDAEARLRHALNGSSRETFTLELAMTDMPGWFEISAYPAGDGLSLFARNVSKRVLAERRLGESELRYGALVKTSPDAIIVFVDNLIVYANPAAHSIYGSESPDDLVGRSIYDIIQPEEANATAERVKTITEKRVIVPPREMKLVRKGGQMIHLEVISAPVMYGGKNAVQTILRDITERKSSELRLRRRSEELLLILDSVPAMIAYLDSDGRFVRVNRALADAMSIPPESWRGKAASELFPGPEASAWSVDRRMVESGKPQLGVVSPYRFNTGMVRWMKTDKIPYMDEEGKVGGVIMIADDISDLLASERQIALQKQLMDKIRDAVVITNRDYEIESWAGGAEAMYGWRADEVMGKDAHEVLQTESAGRTREEVLRELSDGEQVEARVRQRRKDGSWIVADCSAVALRDERSSVIGFASLNRDVTDSKHYEDALERANQRLSLLGSITRHDSLNQLSIIKGWLETAMEEGADDTVREFLRKAQSAADRLGMHLEFTAQYKDMGIKEPGWTSLDDMTSRLTEGLSARGVTLKLDPSGVQLYADPMLEKVFSNLVENSVVHGETVKKITISTRVDGSDMLVVYEDDGCGIPDDEKERIFDRGYGANSGYGLYLSREILSITGIEILETGRPGEGARFEIRVPQGAYRMGSSSTNVSA